MITPYCVIAINSSKMICNDPYKPTNDLHCVPGVNGKGKLLPRKTKLSPLTFITRLDVLYEKLRLL